MSIEEIWLANLRELVSREGDGDRRKGYRAVATAAGVSEEYIYQLCEGKPKKDGASRQVGKRIAKKIASAFAEGRDVTWFDRPINSESGNYADSGFTNVGRISEAQKNKPTEITETFKQLARIMQSVDEITRDQLAALVARLIKEPEKASEIGRRAQAAIDHANEGTPGKRISM